MSRYQFVPIKSLNSSRRRIVPCSELEPSKARVAAVAFGLTHPGPDGGSLATVCWQGGMKAGGPFSGLPRELRKIGGYRTLTHEKVRPLEERSLIRTTGVVWVLR